MHTTQVEWGEHVVEPARAILGGVSTSRASTGSGPAAIAASYTAK